MLVGVAAPRSVMAARGAPELFWTRKHRLARALPWRGAKLLPQAARGATRPLAGPVPAGSRVDCPHRYGHFRRSVRPPWEYLPL